MFIRTVDDTEIVCQQFVLNAQEAAMDLNIRATSRWSWIVHRIGIIGVCVGLIAGCSSETTQPRPSLAAIYVLPKPVTLDASAAGAIILVSSSMTLNPDYTWIGRDTVTNSEAGSGIPQEFTGGGTYSISQTDSTLILRASGGTVTNFDILNGGLSLRRLSTFGRVLLYNRLASTRPN